MNHRIRIPFMKYFKMWFNHFQIFKVESAFDKVNGYGWATGKYKAPSIVRKNGAPVFYRFGGRRKKILDFTTLSSDEFRGYH